MTGIVLPGRWPRADRPLLDRGAEYGAVHQLLIPFLPLVGDLPARQ